MAYTVEQIKAMIIENDKAVLRGVLAIYDRQTADEQSADTTSHNNGIGFNGVDAPIMSSFAKFILKYNRLSEKQMAIARKKMVKYCGQLTRIANERGE